MIAPQAVLALGPPAAGKSSLAGSICEVIDPDRVALLIAKSGEESSYQYVKHGLKPTFFLDKEWIPTLGKYVGGGYKRLLQYVWDLYEDDHYDAVIVDPGTDVVKLIEHHILAPYNVGSFGDLKEARSAYRSLADIAEEFVSVTAMLASPEVKRPKWVIIPWHVQPAKEGQTTRDGKVESADERGQGVEYLGGVMPQIEGSYRRKLAADFGVVVYCDLETKRNLRTGKTDVEHFLQVAPNAERHAKVRATKVLEGRVPNTMAALIAAMEEAQG